MRAINHHKLSETHYPAVRLAWRDRGIEMSDAELERSLFRMFPEADPEEVENFMRGFRNLGRQLAPVARTVVPLAQRALPGAIQGAMQGGMVAGPWGAVAGALGGGAMSLLSSPQPAPGATPAPASPTAPPAAQPNAPVQPAQPAAAPAAPAMATPAAPTGTSPAAAQLLALLSRPETLQALQALLLGAAGRPAVNVGNRQVPSVAFANAISELAAEAAETADLTDDEDDFLYTEEGEARCDIANRSEQSALLLTDLATLSDEEAVDDADDWEDALGEDDLDDDYPDNEYGAYLTPEEIANYYEERYA